MVVREPGIPAAVTGIVERTETSAAADPEPDLSSLQAVLWDFDGTIADSEQLWMQAEFELIPVWADDPDVWNLAHAKRMVGNSLVDSGRYILDVIGRHDLSPAWVMEQLSARVNELLASGEIPWMPGALELLAALRSAGVPCALVSASFRPTLRIVTSRLPAGSFAAVVAGDEVERGKPHPEPYLTGARMLGVDPRHCVAIEDSVPGATSANAAGAVVLAVRNHVPIPPAPRRVLAETLRGVTPAELDCLVVDAARDDAARDDAARDDPARDDAAGPSALDGERPTEPRGAP